MAQFCCERCGSLLDGCIDDYEPVFIKNGLVIEKIVFFCSDCFKLVEDSKVIKEI